MHLRRSIAVLLVVLGSTAKAGAQDLLPGAFVPAPVGFNVVTIATTVNHGDLTFDPSLPIEDGRASIQMLALVVNRTLGIAGRSGSLGVTVPYVHGRADGVLLGEPVEATRSGFADLAIRAAVNLLGAPAMTPQQFAAYRQATILGLSVTVGMPTGQYDPSKRLNLGNNRWSIKPELGFSRTRGRWTLEGVAAATFFGDNTNFLNGGTLDQTSIVAGQGHLIYTVRRGLWIAVDANFWGGGLVTRNGVADTRQQKNSRLGATVALPVKRQQLRIAYSYGAYTTIGGDYLSLGVSYSVAWAGRP